MFVINKSALIVDKVIVQGRELQVKYHCSGEIEDYLTGTSFTVEYGHDIEHVPESILIIPFLATVCPVTWVTNTKIDCDQVDLQFFKSLNEIKDSFRAIYPDLTWEGDLNPYFVINNEKVSPVHSKAALFYSGGINSTASYVQRREEHPLLISICGADSDVDSENEGFFQEEIEEFARLVGTDVSIIKSNFKQVINYPKIDLRFYEKVDGKWWDRVQKHFAMIGLAAPVTHTYKITKLYFSLTRSPSLDIPASYYPDIEHRISWGSDSFRLIPQGNVLTRHEKVILIRNYLTNNDLNIKFKVCLNSHLEHNCGTCEKCKVTIMSLLLEGLNPVEYGFEQVDQSTLATIREEVETNGLPTPESIYHYEDIQNHVKYKKDELTEFALEFFDWFDGVNFKKVNKQIRRKEILVHYKKRTKSKVRDIVPAGKAQEIISKIRKKSND